MVIIVDNKKAYINPKKIEFDKALVIDGDTIKENLTEINKQNILNAVEYQSLIYINTKE